MQNPHHLRFYCSHFICLDIFKSLKTALLCSQRRHSLPQFNSFMSKAKSLGSQCRSFNKIRLVLEVIQTCFCFCYMLINMTLQFQFHTPIDFLSSFPSKGVNIKSCMVWLIDWYLTPTLTIFQLYLGVS
jgi:hypothetical protein